MVVMVVNRGNPVISRAKRNYFSKNWVVITTEFGSRSVIKC